MVQGRQRQTTYEKTRIQGNTVRKHSEYTRLEEVKRPLHSISARKNRDKAQYMNLGYVSFLIGALVIAAIIMVNYIQLRSDITSGTSQIAKLEASLNSQIRSNSEELSRLESSIDLEQIKRVAIYELGMTYANESQIITYENNQSDYVRQFADIPQ